MAIPRTAVAEAKFFGTGGSVKILAAVFAVYRFAFVAKVTSRTCS
jgi:hypothetical protein